jgi:hypothetical protein
MITFVFGLKSAKFPTFQTVKVKESSRLRWVGHVVRMNGNELPKKILWRRSRDRSVGIATRYGLDGPGIESR